MLPCYHVTFVTKLQSRDSKIGYKMSLEKYRKSMFNLLFPKKKQAGEPAFAPS